MQVVISSEVGAYLSSFCLRRGSSFPYPRAGISGMRCKGLHASPGPMRRSSSLTFPTIHNCTLRNLRVPIGANPSISSWINCALVDQSSESVSLAGYKNSPPLFLHMILQPSSVKATGRNPVIVGAKPTRISIVSSQQRKTMCRDFHLTTIR